MAILAPNYGRPTKQERRAMRYCKFMFSFKIRLYKEETNG